jgi:hypothetical protein
MKMLLLLWSLVLVSSISQAAVELDSYPLTPKQKKAAQALIDKGASDELVLKFINYCLNPKPAPKVYVPPHTQDELMAIQRWAGIGAFASFAKEAGYIFDSERYQKDCPNWVLFNFGRQTGMKYINADVTQTFLGLTYGLQVGLAKDPTTFPDVFWKYAVTTGADKYLTKKSI